MAADTGTAPGEDDDVFVAMLHEGRGIARDVAPATVHETGAELSSACSLSREEFTAMMLRVMQGGKAARKSAKGRKDENAGRKRKRKPSAGAAVEPVAVTATSKAYCATWGSQSDTELESSGSAEEEDSDE